MKRRFMFAFIALSLLVLLVQDIPLSLYLRQVQTDRIVSTLKQDAFVLAGHAQPSLQDPKSNDTVELTRLAKTYREAGGARVVIVDSTGTAIVTNDDDQSSVGASYASRPEIASALGGSIES